MGDYELIVTDEEIRNFGEKVKLKSNRGIHQIEDVNGGFGSSKRRLRKWKRIPREAVKKSSSNLNGEIRAYNSEEDLSSRSSTAASFPIIEHEHEHEHEHDHDLKRNGRIEPGKKARGVGICTEKVSDAMGSDSGSVNFVFVQGSKSRESGGFGKCDEECSDAAYSGDKDLNEELRVEFGKSGDGFGDDDVLEEDGKTENDGEKIDSLVESIKGLSFAHDEFEREVQKWRDIGQNDPLICEDPMHELLEFQDAKILELESVLNSEHTRTELENTLKKIIQAEVEYIAIKTTTESLTAEAKHNLQQKNISSQKLDTAEDVKKQKNGEVSKKQAEELKTREDVKEKNVSRLTSLFFIQMILWFVMLYFQFSPRNVEIVPT